MLAKDLMTTPVLTIAPAATIREAAGLMLEKQVGCLPVVDDGGNLVGILTESDFELHQKLIAMPDELYELPGHLGHPKHLGTCFPEGCRQGD